MKKVLANDGIADNGKKMLEEAGFEVVTDKVAQEKLADALSEYDALIVRSATKVTADVLQGQDRLKLVGRAGVGLDNIDLPAAEAQGIKVVNTPAASSLSVAELAMGHLFGAVRFLHRSNRDMPKEGKTDFKSLKKAYSKGTELRGKTMGIIGAGRIGRETAKIAFGVGMKILFHDPYVQKVPLTLDNIQTVPIPEISIETVELDTLLASSDVVSLHVPFGKGDQPIIAAEQLGKMKDGAGLINLARGGAVHENDLLEALQSGKLAFACLDVFENEPTPDQRLLDHPQVSVTPHIGASTNEAQDRIAIEMAQKVIDHFETVEA
jgi:D-3-phosphoglycerate dehydrogenase